MKPYKIITEDENSITYQYNSSYTWALYGLLVIMLAGVITENTLIKLASGILAIIFVVLKLTQGKEATTKIKAALHNKSVKLSGSKHSFSNPLTIKIPKDA